MNADDRTRLQHMLDAATEAVSFVKGKMLSDLASDRVLALALTKELEIIGEAAGRVSEPCKANLPGVPWQVAVGIRNRLIHAYFDVDLTIVWSTVTSDLPSLIAELERALVPEG